MKEDIKIRVSNIEKSFPGVKALQNVNFLVKKGTLHALCGENGAGKSTLMKIISGLYKPDGGQIFIDGEEVHIENPIQAREMGIAMIAQELNFVPEMSIEENIFLGRLPVNKYGKVDWKKLRKDTQKFIDENNLPYTPDQKMKTLTVSDIQMLEIIKAISFNADIIIMDEPTSSITEAEVEVLFKKIAELKANNVSIIYISHKLEEVFQLADEITVLRDGEVVETHPTYELTMDKVISLMVGREITNVYPKETIKIKDIKFEVKDLSSKGVFKNINFDVREGEIVGFAGLVGAGRTELMRAIFGLDPYDSGDILLNDQKIEVNTVPDALNKGIAMLSEDRRRYGIIPIRSVRENASISRLDKFIYGGYAREEEEKKVVGEYFDKLNVKTPSQDTAIQALSGGNQQKVLLARWLICEPEILILDEPTRGIDVGAKFEIYKLMGELAKEGKAIILVSSELTELIGMCDRIYVMNQGRLTGELDRDSFNQETIMKHATLSDN